MHNVPFEWFTATMEAQGGRCAICRITLERKGRKNKRNMMCIDHDHATGAVRGILCGHCNIALGYFEERQESLSAAITYLATHASSPLTGSV
jgi:hypothetical protein